MMSVVSNVCVMYRYCGNRKHADKQSKTSITRAGPVAQLQGTDCRGERVGNDVNRGALRMQWEGMEDQLAETNFIKRGPQTPTLSREEPKPEAFTNAGGYGQRIHNGEHIWPGARGPWSSGGGCQVFVGGDDAVSCTC
jgi:hypothetical protein